MVIILERVIIFVDGSNFYHSIKNQDVIKINHASFFNSLITQNQKLINIYYYNSPVNQKQFPRLYVLQQKYFSKLSKIENIVIKLGRLEERNNNLKEKIQESFKYIFLLLSNLKINDNLDKIKNEFLKLNNLFAVFLEKGNFVEKGVDVNIALDLVTLAYENKYDCAILISNDSDFVPAIKHLINLNKKVIGVFFKNSKAYHLKTNCSEIIKINNLDEFKL